MPFPEAAEPENEGARNRLVFPLASFLNDFAWEVPTLLLPLFIVNVLGASALAVGVVEGAGDATATIAKLFSGILADRTGKRKAITATGYAAAGLTRPLLFFVTAWPGALAIRFTERLGKGIRGSARDALLADSTPVGESGRAFGLLRAGDTLGAFGSMIFGLVVIRLMQGDAHLLSGSTFRTMVAVATIPGLLALLTIVVLVKDVPTRRHVGLDLTAHEGLPRVFFYYTAISAVFTLGNSSDAFIILRGQSLGGSVFTVVALFAGFNLIYGLASSPFGRLSDRFGKRPLIVIGWLIYAGTYLGFARATGLVAVGLLLIPYGLYYALTEGVGRALIADVAPSGSRGAAFGIFGGANGAAALLASVGAGALYARFGPPTPFYIGAGLAGVAAVLLVLMPISESRNRGA